MVGEIKTKKKKKYRTGWISHQGPCGTADAGRPLIIAEVITEEETTAGRMSTHVLFWEGTVRGG